jgi:hypothetical protein
VIVYALVVGHFLADFVCQSDWMAANKGKRWDALALHVGVYTAVLGLIVSFVLPPSAYPYDSALAFGLWVALNAAAHFVQDAITSRINARFWFFKMDPGIWVQAPFMVPRDDRTIVNPWLPIEGKQHWFFVGIGADQMLHYITLFATAGWLLGAA